VNPVAIGDVVSEATPTVLEGDVVRALSPSSNVDTRLENSSPTRRYIFSPANTNTPQAAQQAAPAPATSDTLFLSQLLGSEENAASFAVQSNFARAASAYRSTLTPTRDYSPTLSPKKLEEFSQVKYKPGLRPPETPSTFALVA
jgi:hypothetical protein